MTVTVDLPVERTRTSRLPPPVAFEVASADSVSVTWPVPLKASMSAPVNVTESEPSAVFSPKLSPDVPSKSVSPS
jgi:hypothetical protein